MSSGEGRLRALRLVGFKSFAEKTTVEFGPGISCVIGPNGSGKSNLADALRWALGEQGRSLRTRRAEDLIFAGSSTRRAIGMADVTLVIDNRDRLLPVDFGEIELGRRLFRSGENEYLLNRQRIRLRDLVDLLDEANLADNAFLFIGQGMVDQALALRPEERRPLFEEAAGIRKHERRRRLAEAELAEAEQNLERIRDVLAELRPQARRLAAQAEQQEKRRSAASELAEALVASGRARLLDAENETVRATGEGGAARTEADVALGALRDAEEAARALTESLSDRADRERAQRAELDGARARSLELRLGQARMASEADAHDRERARLERDRAEAEQRRASLLRDAALPVPELDAGLEAALRDAEQALGQQIAERDGLRAGTLKEAERRASWLAARQAEDAALDRARARAAELLERVAASERRATEQGSNLDVVLAEVSAATESARIAIVADEDAERELEAARQALAAAEAALADVVARESRAVADLASLDARIGSLEAAVAALTDQEALRAARRRGGTLVAEGLDVDPQLRVAVEAALGDALRGIVVDRSAALALRERRAVLVVDGGEPGRSASASSTGRGANSVGRGATPVGRSSERDRASVVAAAEAAGGGALTPAVRRDPGGRVTRLLERTVWVDSFEAALELAPTLPGGWRVVTRDGELVTDEGIARVGPPPSHLETEAQLRLLRADRQGVSAAVDELRAVRTDSEAGRSAARTALEAARTRGQSTRNERRIAEERERVVARRAEGQTREEAWNTSTLERLREQLAAADAELERRARTAEAVPGTPSPDALSGGSSGARRQLEDADRRLDGLRQDRDARARAHADDRVKHAAALDLRARAEIGAGLEEQRLLQLERELESLNATTAGLGEQREDVSTRLAAAIAQEERLDRALQGLLDASRDERARLTAAETSAREARERLRQAEGRSRAAEVAEMEARLRFDSIRESLLVELAGIGPAALAALTGATEEVPVPGSMEELGPALEATLATSLDRWRAEPPLELVPSGRLAALRRRYHELGASNPFAAQEYAEIRERVETLDAQRADLETAIRNTRELIASVNTLISDQFRRTFQQLEGAFARRFTQLFDGGEAQLSLTVPDDLSATGVEITARPPGKKRQPLAMLSGGERTLTAVALLLAMLEVRPVPFCVLDEVDAALDEANVGRFSSALRELAERIQFVVITHNRGTIEVADALYGVTVDDDSVSRVISMRLADLPTKSSGSRVGRDELVPVGPAA